MGKKSTAVMIPARGSYAYCLSKVSNKKGSAKVAAFTANCASHLYSIAEARAGATKMSARKAGIIARATAFLNTTIGDIVKHHGKKLSALLYDKDTTVVDVRGVLLANNPSQCWLAFFGLSTVTKPQGFLSRSTGMARANAKLWKDVHDASISGNPDQKAYYTELLKCWLCGQTIKSTDSQECEHVWPFGIMGGLGIAHEAADHSSGAGLRLEFRLSHRCCNQIKREMLPFYSGGSGASPWKIDSSVVDPFFATLHTAKTTAGTLAQTHNYDCDEIGQVVPGWRNNTVFSKHATKCIAAMNSEYKKANPKARCVATHGRHMIATLAAFGFTRVPVKTLITGKKKGGAEGIYTISFLKNIIDMCFQEKDPPMDSKKVIDIVVINLKPIIKGYGKLPLLTFFTFTNKICIYTENLLENLLQNKIIILTQNEIFFNDLKTPPDAAPPQPIPATVPQETRSNIAPTETAYTAYIMHEFIKIISDNYIETCLSIKTSTSILVSGEVPKLDDPDIIKIRSHKCGYSINVLMNFMNFIERFPDTSLDNQSYDGASLYINSDKDPELDAMFSKLKKIVLEESHIVYDRIEEKIEEKIKKDKTEEIRDPSTLIGKTARHTIYMRVLLDEICPNALTQPRPDCAGKALECISRYTIYSSKPLILIYCCKLFKIDISFFEDEDLSPLLLCLSKKQLKWILNNFTELDKDIFEKCWELTNQFTELERYHRAEQIIVAMWLNHVCNTNISFKYNMNSTNFVTGSAIPSDEYECSLYESPPDFPSISNILDEAITHMAAPNKDGKTVVQLYKQLKESTTRGGAIKILHEYTFPPDTTSSPKIEYKLVENGYDHSHLELMIDFVSQSTSWYLKSLENVFDEFDPDRIMDPVIENAFVIKCIQWYLNHRVEYKTDNSIYTYKTVKDGIEIYTESSGDENLVPNDKEIYLINTYCTDSIRTMLSVETVKIYPNEMISMEEEFMMYGELLDIPSITSEEVPLEELPQGLRKEMRATEIAAVGSGGKRRSKNKKQYKHRSVKKHPRTRKRRVKRHQTYRVHL
jgi:hypothetical protein